jgi:UDP-N-acetyl-alpha-D-muramoyl-L-alanyl-L-glutamate epimerase
MFMSFAADGRRFTKRYRYSDVDFEALGAQYGREFLDRLCFHIMALEAIPLASLQPGELDLGRFARFHNARFERLWRTVFIKACAQWRYENKLPHYLGPAFSSQSAAVFRPVEAGRGPVDTLCFCGGGKDSLAAMKLFESTSLPFSSYSYSHPAYGPAATQFALVESLLDATTAGQRHLVEIESDAPADTGVLCAETPISIFGALPVALQHGYRWLVLGNERSAEEPNLHWPRTGEFVNHQWGKSLEAELLIGSYVSDELVSNLRCFSVLRPMHDTVIFNFLRRFPHAVNRTHSCNRRKPWCFECAKCAYVALGFNAYLPDDLAREIVPAGLFGTRTNQLLLRQLLGLEDHKPFECVGEIGEARLAFEICRLKGLRGAFDLYADEIPLLKPAEFARTYCEIAPPPPSFPAELSRALTPLMLAAGRDSLRYISSICGFDRSLAAAGAAARA